MQQEHCACGVLPVARGDAVFVFYYIGIYALWTKFATISAIPGFVDIGAFEHQQAGTVEYMYLEMRYACPDGAEAVVAFVHAVACGRKGRRKGVGKIDCAADNGD